MIRVDAIEPGYAPIRTPGGLMTMKEDEALKQSIAKHGIQTPLTVVATDDTGSRYRVADGARRFRAAKELGLSEIPCSVFPYMSRGNFELLRLRSQREWK